MKIKNSNNAEKCHTFNVQAAIDYGLEKAVILSNFCFWLDFNKANGTNHHDGYYWTYNTAEALAELMPYIGKSKMARLLRELEKDGVIITGNYNKKGYDRTKWYSMPCYASMFKNEQCNVQITTMDSSNLNNAMFKNEPPIPDINHIVNKIVNTDIKDLCDLEKNTIGDDQGKQFDNDSSNPFLNQSKNEESVVKKNTKRGSSIAKLINIPFDEFWSMYDKKQDRAKCEKKWHSLTDEERLLTMNHLPAYIESTPNKQYRKHPATYLNGEAWNNEVISNLPTVTNNQQGYNNGQQQSASQPTTDAQSYMDSLRRNIPAATTFRDVN